MLEELDARLADISERHARCESAAMRLASARTRTRELERRRKHAREVLEREQADVERLEGLSLAALFQTLIGKKEEKLAKEQQELLAARLELDTQHEALAEVEADVQRLELEAAPLESLRVEYDAALSEKERWIQQHGGAPAVALFELAQQDGRARDELREVGEAYSAANKARKALKQCADSLSSASSWGTFDLLGGGLVSSMIKHGKMDEANKAASLAQRALAQLERELEDIGRSANLEVKLEGLNRFGDLFFDGLVFDWIAQSKIGRSKENVDRTIVRVRTLQAQLEARDQELRAKIEQLSIERKRSIAETGPGSPS